MKEGEPERPKTAPRTRILLHLGRWAVWLGTAAAVTAMFVMDGMRIILLAVGAAGVIGGTTVGFLKAEHLIQDPPADRGMYFRATLITFI